MEVEILEETKRRVKVKIGHVIRWVPKWKYETFGEDWLIARYGEKSKPIRIHSLGELGEAT